MEAIVAALNALFSNRVFPGIAPLNAPLPFLTYVHVGGTVIETFCGPVEQRNKLIQFNIWTARQEQAHDLMESVRTILIATPFRASPSGEMTDLYDEPTRQHGARQDFSFWS